MTWHYVTPEVDTGRIIVQEKIPIRKDTVSFSLLREQNNLALSLLTANIDAILHESCMGTPQQPMETRMHYSWERPNDGLLNLEWPADKISAFLRCYDYGILKTLGVPFIRLKGMLYEWKRYSIQAVTGQRETSTQIRGCDIVIQKNGIEIRLLNIQEVHAGKK